MDKFVIHNSERLHGGDEVLSPNVSVFFNQIYGGIIYIHSDALINSLNYQCCSSIPRGVIQEV